MIQSVQRAAQILVVLGSGTPRLGVTEIADRLGLAKPTVHGLLRTLEAHELIAQDQDTGKYSLGPGVLQLGNAYLDGSDLRARSLRWAEGLAQQAKEAVWVATLSGGRVIVLAPRVPPGQHRADPGGRRGDPVARVRARPRDRREPACRAAGPGARGGPGAADRPDQDDTQRAHRALNQVRTAGYAIESEEATVGDAGVAAPILGRDDAVAGAIGVVGSADRLLAPGTRDELVRVVIAAARAISRDLGAGRGGVALSAL